MRAIIGTIIDSTFIKDGFRRIKLRWLGRNALREVVHAKEAGTDANPHPGTKMLILKTLNPKEDVAMMAVSSDAREDLKEGEKAFYSYDADGNALFVVTIRGDKMEIGTAPDGTAPSNFAVRFNEMETSYNTLKDDLNAAINVINTHIHITTATVGATATVGVIAPTTTQATASTASMSEAKSEELLIN